MKKYKRWSAALLCLLAAFILLPMNALAVDSVDLSRDVSLTVSCRDGKTPLTGARFELYLVAAMDDSNELTATETFARYNVDLQAESDEDWKALASTLEGYVLRDAVAATDSGITDGNGLASFPSEGKRLTPGLYLVLGCRHTQNGYRYDPAPFVVMLPGLDGESSVWVYDVTANAKLDSSKVPADPGDDTVDRKVLKVWDDEGNEKERPAEVVVQLLRDGRVYDTVPLSADNSWRHTWTGLGGQYAWTVVEKEPEDYTVKVAREGITFVVTNTYNGDSPDEPTPTDPFQPHDPTPGLPQTGQLWWPVPLLIVAGLLCVVIGLLRRKGAEHE